MRGLGLTDDQNEQLKARWRDQEAYAQPIVEARNGETRYGFMNAFYSVATAEENAQMKAWKDEDMRLIEGWVQQNLQSALGKPAAERTAFDWETLTDHGYAKLVEDEGDDMRQGGFYHVESEPKPPSFAGETEEELARRGL